MPVWSDARSRWTNQSTGTADLVKTTGTASDTLTNAPATYTQTDEDNFRKSVAVKINTILAALRDAGIIV